MMVFFLINRQGYADFMAIQVVGASLWVSAGVLEAHELQSMRASGINVTNLSFRLNTDERSAIEHALDTIREHHPGEAIWVSA